MSKIQKLLTIGLTSVTIVWLAACGNNPKAANKGNFKTSLNAHFENNKECFRFGRGITEKGYIIEIRDFKPKQKSKRLTDKEYYDGFMDLGLLERETFTRRDISLMPGRPGKELQYFGYKLTDAANAYLPTEGGKNLKETHLCYATRNVVNVLNFTEPAEQIGATVSRVDYSYTLQDIAPWANSPIITARYPQVTEQLAKDTLKDNDDLILTNNGWVHHSQY